MKNKMPRLLIIGLLLNTVVIIINRFIIELPDFITIILALTAVIFMIKGGLEMSKNKPKGVNE